MVSSKLYRHPTCLTIECGTVSDSRTADPLCLLRAYIGRVEAKHEHAKAGGGGADAGHQQQINGLGQSFRKAEGLPAYQEVTGAAPPPPQKNKT